MKFTPNNITELQPSEIFVFGSNLRGYHGAGAARTALQFGAEMDNGRGLCGQTYALPTKDGHIQTLSLMTIKYYVDEFISYATKHPEYTFLVTRVGCGLAGFKDEHIAPLFIDALEYKNIVLPQSFYDIITQKPLFIHMPEDFDHYMGEEGKIDCDELEDILSEIIEICSSKSTLPHRIEFSYNGRIEAKVYDQAAPTEPDGQTS